MRVCVCVCALFYGIIATFDVPLSAVPLFSLNEGYRHQTTLADAKKVHLKTGQAKTTVMVVKDPSNSKDLEESAQASITSKCCFCNCMQLTLLSFQSLAEKVPHRSVVEATCRINALVDRNRTNDSRHRCF